MRILLTICLISFSLLINAKSFKITVRSEIAVAIDTTIAPIVKTAFEILDNDIEKVFESHLRAEPSSSGKVAETNQITIQINPSLPSQGFKILVDNNGALLIDGADVHGLAYGMLELSRLIGVSPWEWWADVTPRHKDEFELKQGFVSEQSPSVEYRGIFINDEDWGMMPWSYQTNEPAEKGIIGPKTYAKIFELLLRLRANYIWPAMHECSRPFFLTDGNREVAKKYGIYMGGSHCEPMACSTAVEWGKRGVGQYNYVSNADNVRKFWTDRLKDVKDQDILYTIGMRGVHDSGMQGVKTADDKLFWLQKVIDDQREMLKEYVNKDVEKVPQVFIPYKEVQEIYNSGLKVPEDVCLMWCDDNYGYIRHFPTDQERTRKGGNGIYYHASYWGAPQDHLWLGTFSPSLLFEQMNEAWDRGIQRVWVLNVGDLKPLEYQMELFLDMAWNINSVKKDFEDVVNVGNFKYYNAHLFSFLCREFGDKIGKELFPIMQKYYQLAFVRKPEFMGGNRVYESNREEWYKIVDMPWTDEYVDERLSEYDKLENSVEKIYSSLPIDRKDAFFQLVKYPVQASSEMNKKMLYAQKARHGQGEVYWTKSDEAFDSIASLTNIYNKGVNGLDKWNHMMDFQPRKLSVFNKVPHTAQKPDPSQRAAITYNIPPTPIATMNGTDFSGDVSSAYGVGLESSAVKLAKEGSAISNFVLPSTQNIKLLIHLLPHFPIIENGTLRVSVSVDDAQVTELSFQSVYHDELWKEGVIQNYAERELVLDNLAKGKHKIKVSALDEGVILDQVIILSNK